MMEGRRGRRKRNWRAEREKEIAQVYSIQQQHKDFVRDIIVASYFGSDPFDCKNFESIFELGRSLKSDGDVLQCCDGWREERREEKRGEEKGEK